jgi:hypothetical protein
MPPNPNIPNTLGISNGIVTLVQAVVFPTAIDGGTTYKLVKQGALKDATEEVPWASVRAMRGTSKHYAAGGRVDEKPVFQIMSGVSYQDSTQAEIDVITIRDAIVPLFQAHSTLQGVMNVYTLIVRDGSEQYAYLALMDVIYRVHLFEITVSQQYQLIAGVID